MTKTTKSKKAPIAPAKPKPAKAAKTIYRLCVADEGRQVVGECGSAEEATKKAKAFQKKNAVPVEIARGKVSGSAFTAEFTEVVQPAGTKPIEPDAAADVEPTPTSPSLFEPTPEVASAEPTTPTEAAIATEATVSQPAELPAKPPATKAPRAKTPKADGKQSALDAAAQVLKASGKPMSTSELIEEMAKQKLWESPNGKTPAATLYSAILREINVKGQAARFKKTDRGRFEFAGK